MAHPSGRHPVFTRVVAHPCATWAIFPGHGVLGELQGRGFDQRGDLGKGQAVAVFRLLHSSRQPDRSKRCNDRSHAPDAPGGRRPVAMGVERHRDVPRSRAEARTPARATTPVAAGRRPRPKPTLLQSGRRSNLIHPKHWAVLIRLGADCDPFQRTRFGTREKAPKKRAANGGPSFSLPPPALNSARAGSRRTGAANRGRRSTNRSGSARRCPPACRSRR